jgi:F-type H+-transporting ATPase subunit b
MGWNTPHPASANLKKLMEILNQLGGLMLGSVPTMIFFILLVLAYSLLVQKPLTAVLKERAARTSGAVEQARGAISAAEAETEVYEAKLRAARADIAGAREHRLQQWQKERDAAVTAARDQAHAKALAAKNEIHIAAETAKQQIAETTAQLSDSILRAILPEGAGATGAHPQ